MLTLGQLIAAIAVRNIHYNVCVGSDCNPILGCNQADIIIQHRDDVVKTYVMNTNDKSGRVTCTVILSD